jgi:hypothetical protein
MQVPPPLAPRGDTLWWLWNRTGKLLLDLFGLGSALPHAGPTYGVHRAETIELRDAAVTAIAELARGPAASTPRPPG